MPVLHDWRLRECDSGQVNGAPCAKVHEDRARRLTVPYPGGESWTAAVARVAKFLRDVLWRWRGERILVVGHVATRWCSDRYIDGIPLDALLDMDFAWQEGWEYRLAKQGSADR